ncbi:MAG: ABC transporter permease [Actinomycetota bacterium]|nr:ABC transporter permease [Actinomycetota bacterium]
MRIVARATQMRRSFSSQNTKVKVGIILTLIFVAVAIFGPILAPYDPSAQSAAQGASVAAPSASHLFGTDQLGRDIFSQVLVGTRTTLLLGILTGLIATALSVLVGVTSAYIGGLGDELLSLVSNIFLVFPALPFLIVVLGAFPKSGESAMILLLAFLGWPWGARVIRAQTLSLRNRDFITAARESGESNFRIIIFELLPNELSLIAASFVGTVLYAIGASVGLDFLGVGNTTTWSLGTILYWAQNGNALQLGAWWWFAIPGVIIALIGTGLVLLNFGLDEIGNPRLRDSNSSIKVGGRRVRPSDPTPVLIGEAAGFVAKSKSHKGWRSSQASTDETTGETGEKLGDSVSLVATIAGSNGELRSDDAMGSGDNLIKSSIEADAHGSTSERKGA